MRQLAQIIVCVLLATTMAALPRPQSNSSPLTLDDVLKLLDAGVRPVRVKAAVTERGVGFLLNDAVEKDLRDAGATDDLILQIAKSYRPGSAPHPSASQSKNTRAAEEVQATEKERVRALTGGDWAALERMLAEELTYTGSTASVATKAQFLDSLRSGALLYEKMEHSDVAVRVYGETAVVTGRSNVRARLPGAQQMIEAQIRFTSVYAKLSGRWQQVAWQSTQIPEPAAGPKKP